MPIGVREGVGGGAAIYSETPFRQEESRGSMDAIVDGLCPLALVWSRFASIVGERQLFNWQRAASFTRVLL